MLSSTVARCERVIIANCDFSPSTQLLKRAIITQLLKSQSTRNVIIIIFTTHLNPVLRAIYGLFGNIEVS